ncbi:hypothetical protein DL93DRAFT_2174685 [Clavulina sp. PMI_390]|nr:hypothetical protein DL93DRAFT_2174685 [Clavulina sp. PMI_390]
MKAVKPRLGGLTLGGSATIPVPIPLPKGMGLEALDMVRDMTMIAGIYVQCCKAYAAMDRAQEAPKKLPE